MVGVNQRVLQRGKPRLGSLELFSKLGKLLPEFGEFAAQGDAGGLELGDAFVFSANGEGGGLGGRSSGGRGECGHIDGAGQ